LHLLYFLEILLKDPTSPSTPFHPPTPQWVHCGIESTLSWLRMLYFTSVFLISLSTRPSISPFLLILEQNQLYPHLKFVPKLCNFTFKSNVVSFLAVFVITGWSASTPIWFPWEMLPHAGSQILDLSPVGQISHFVNQQINSQGFESFENEVRADRWKGGKQTWREVCRSFSWHLHLWDPSCLVIWSLQALLYDLIFL
jgi:hypothetical protein